MGIITYTFTCSQLQEAFVKGLLKPGLNLVIEKDNKKLRNCVVSYYDIGYDLFDATSALKHFSSSFPQIPER